MKKQTSRTISLKMRVTLKGEDRYISQITINGKRIPEKAVLALATTLHRHHIKA